MQSTTKSEKKATRLKFERRFTKEEISPFDQFKYDLRQSTIKNVDGEKVFTMNNVEVPEEWSQLATDILAQKYFRKSGVPQPDGSSGSEHSVKQVVHRLANGWRTWGEKYGYFATTEDAQVFYDEIAFTLLAQYTAPNSPQWFNTGLYESYGITGNSQGHYYVNPDTEILEKSKSAYERPQVHACFILSVSDDLVNEGGVMDLWVKEARIFKYGSGVGSNFSKVRGKNEKLSGGGFSSGLMSFLKVGDRAAGAIKSGGTTRRAAKMVCLDLDHPEVESFINWKLEEERKVAALIAAGFPADYEGEAYQTVSGQNSNNSVRVPNTFFKALGENKDWELRGRTNGLILDKVPSQRLWDSIANATWSCGDPGVQFDTTINEWHTCPEGGRINASNPCSEYMFLDNTACNLASMNLRKFWDDTRKQFDVEAYEHVCRLWTVVLEISVLMAQFPSKEIAQLSYEYRTLGLGYANLGGLLMRAGIAYDSEQARAMAAAFTSIMTGIAYRTSAEMAQTLGPFKQYDKNKKHMLRVIKNHKTAAFNKISEYEGLEIKPQGIDARLCPDYLVKAAQNAWDEALKKGEKHGYRNAQVSVIAPTGTIGLVMDCDTTGVEPDFALVKFKKLAGGGGLKIVNQAVPVALRSLGYAPDKIQDVIQYLNGSGTFVDAPYINHKSLHEKGFTDADLQKLDGAVKSAFEISNVFNVYVLGDECLKRFDLTPAQYTSYNFNLLKYLGFTEEEIEDANDYVCGSMTIEGAPHLKDEHLPVFDCANRCGKKGRRFLSPLSHIKMMAAVQPFISGAISKTINMPTEATPEEIKKCYEISWQLGLKACAIYRDGSKQSQPLSGTVKSSQSGEVSLSDLLNDASAEQVLEAAQNILNNSADTSFKRQLSRIIERKSLPAKRKGFTQKAKIGGQTIFVRTGEYDDGTLGEIFVDMYKEGVSFRSLLNCFAISVSLGLQYGVPLEEFVEKFVFTRFEPSGMVEHPNIKNSTSVLDYLFRMLAYEYCGRQDLVHKPNVENKAQVVETPVTKVEYKMADNNNVLDNQGSEFLHVVSGDAPTCDICGHVTVRSGTCYKCLNCGNSLGCS